MGLEREGTQELASDDGRAGRRPRVERLARETWWRAVDYAAALHWQLAGTLAGGDMEEFRHPRAPVGPPVVLVPGVYESWRFLRPLAVLLHGHGLRVHVLPDLGLNAGPVAHAAEVLGRALVDRDLRDVALVAHSKGGLIGKLAMVGHDPEGRIASMIAVNTPFAGSVYARYLPLGSIRAFVPTDATIVALTAERSVNARITSIHSAWDPHIPAGSHLDGAENVVLDTPGHFRPLSDPRLGDLLVARLIGGPAPR
ncbi:MAG TPA: hypothetical protein VN257_10055 [Actinotalea sp.]|nr:hypothetical protein [Actinotalea sp.]